MNNIELLTAELERYPDNPIVASMLIDELMEVRDQNRSEAEACVRRVQEVAIDAVFMRRATEIVSGCAWQRAWVRDLIAEMLQTYVASTCTLLVIPGLYMPAQIYHPSGQPVGYWTANTVTVGAQWLVREYRVYLAFRREHAAEVRAKKKK